MHLTLKIFKSTLTCLKSETGKTNYDGKWKTTKVPEGNEVRSLEKSSRSEWFSYLERCKA